MEEEGEACSAKGLSAATALLLQRTKYLGVCATGEKRVAHNAGGRVATQVSAPTARMNTSTDFSVQRSIFFIDSRVVPSLSLLPFCSYSEATRLLAFDFYRCVVYKPRASRSGSL